MSAVEHDVEISPNKNYECNVCQKLFTYSYRR